ncbi:MAG: hypothetical protein ABIO24_03755 [Saprospiraceae bacterium]
MTEDNQTPNPEEQHPDEKAPEIKAPKKAFPKSNPASRFNKKNSPFVSSKAGSSSRKGAAFKGGGVKKGK